MRVLVTGAAGQLGMELVPLFDRRGHDVIATDETVLDITDRDAVKQVFTATRPHAVVHTAAVTAVDACEADPRAALRVNGLGTRHVAEAARAVRAHVVYISTDYVFDGRSVRPYHEWDTPNPLSVYGQSKRAGELELAGDPDATIVRVSWLSGRHGSNMVKTVLRLARECEILTFVDDQRGQPTFADDLAAMIARLVSERRPGLFHVTNQGAVSWFEFAQAILVAAGDDPGRVRPIATAELQPPPAAPRPANSVLENLALELSGIALLPDFRDSLERLVAELLAS